MSCTDIRPELIAFHFGDIEPDRREATEAHLLDCADCLREYLGLKRSVETAELEARPSDSARERLRRAVAAEVNAEPAPRPSSWWELPGAVVFASAAVLAAILFVQMVSTGPGAEPRSLDQAGETSP